MGYKILSHLADFSSLKEQLAEIFQPALHLHLSVEHLFLSLRKHPAKQRNRSPLATVNKTSHEIKTLNFV